MELNWKSILTILFVILNSISIYGQETEKYIELIKRDIIKVENKIEQGDSEIKKLNFECKNDPFDGSVIYYHAEGQIEKVLIEYYYEGTYEAITYFLKNGEVVFQEIRERMEIGEYDVMTGKGEKTEEKLTRIYFQSTGQNSKKCIATEMAEGLLLEDHINCEIFNEDYYNRVIDAFQLEENSRVCLFYD